MSDGVRLLALDIASQTGWAYGVPGQLPRSGTIQFAPPGSTNGAAGRGLMRWFSDILKLCPTDAIYFEAPFDPRKMGMKTNMSTSRMLLGLVFTLETLAEAKGIYRLRETEVRDVRMHFLGRNPAGEAGKLAVQARCRQLGWKFDSPDAADALAVWSMACALEAPKSSIATTPLFQPAREKQSRSPIDDLPEIPL